MNFLRTIAAIALLLSSSAYAFADEATPNSADSKTSSAGPDSVKPASEAAADPNDPSNLVSGDIAWMLTSAALVLMMTTPGLALFYGGLVRKKNILSVMMQCVFLMGLLSVAWALWGYSLAFGGTGAFIGNLDHVLLKGVIPFVDDAGQVVTPLSGSIPASLFMVFQGMFAIITPALICGAFAERMRFSSMCVFLLLWLTFVYCPIAHWVWHANGWLCEANSKAMFPALDFAGGTVVHISSGVSALVCALMIGKRRGYPTEAMPPHNLTYTCIGTGLLWVGWFGFNAGSALSAGTSAVNAFVATHLAAAAGILGWSAIEWLKHGKPSILGACSGAVAGLVCITPACGSVTPVAGMILGFLAGIVCYAACSAIKGKFGYDDSLDAFGIHGVGGTLGALLTGIFATKAIHGGDGGLLDGNANQLVNQAVSVIASAGIAIVGTFVILKVLDATMGLRVSDDDELQGLDLSQHGEEGYIFH